MQTITPFLWFDGQAEEAARFYAAIFPDSAIERIVRNGPGGPGPEGSVLTVGFRLAGRSFAALNGGPRFRFNEAVSFAVACPDQAEIDRLWAALSDGGEPGVCGWLKDRFGLSWQVFPATLPAMLEEPESAGRVMAALMGMSRIDLAALERARDG